MSRAVPAPPRGRAAWPPLAARVVPALLGGGVLYAILRLGELLADLAGLPLPGSVLGMVLLWGGLEAGVVRLAWVRDAATLLLGLLGLLFVPAGVGFVDFVDAGWAWVGALAVCAAGTVATVVLTGVVVQRGIRGG